MNETQWTTPSSETTPTSSVREQVARFASGDIACELELLEMIGLL